MKTPIKYQQIIDKINNDYKEGNSLLRADVLKFATNMRDVHYKEVKEFFESGIVCCRTDIMFQIWKLIVVFTEDLMFPKSEHYRESYHNLSYDFATWILKQPKDSSLGLIAHAEFH